MIELRKLSALVDTKEGRLSHRGGLDYDHGSFTDRKIESYPDCIKNKMLKGIAEDLEEIDYKELLKMSCDVNDTKNFPSSSSINILSSCNITLAEPITNSLPVVMESAVSNATILLIRIVSGNKPPDPFIKLSEPIISMESTQAITSALLLKIFNITNSLIKCISSFCRFIIRK